LFHREDEYAGEFVTIIMKKLKEERLWHADDTDGTDLCGFIFFCANPYHLCHLRAIGNAL